MTIDQWMRYIPIVGVLKKYKYLNENIKILEVGSGSNGLGDYLPFKFFGLDLKFEGKINSNLIPIVGSVECLPFKDNTFDVVVSSDMLEHIKKRKRPKVLNELIRVARERIIIACPCGKKAENCEQKIVSWLKFIHRKSPIWLSEHFENGLPSEDEILQVLNKKKIVDYYVVNNENIMIHLIIMIFESIPVISGLFNRIAKLFLNKKCNFIIKLLSIGTPYRKIFIISKKDKIIWME